MYRSLSTNTFGVCLLRYSNTSWHSMVLGFIKSVHTTPNTPIERERAINMEVRTEYLTYFGYLNLINTSNMSADGELTFRASHALVRE